jgi:hypothetical protein
VRPGLTTGQDASDREPSSSVERGNARVNCVWGERCRGRQVVARAPRSAPLYAPHSVKHRSAKGLSFYLLRFR